MHLEYYCIIFARYGDEYPNEQWDIVTKHLKVVYAVFGYALGQQTSHDLYAICEDDAKLTLYNSLPESVKGLEFGKSFITKSAKDITRWLIPWMENLKQQSFYIDNTREVFGDDF